VQVQNPDKIGKEHERAFENAHQQRWMVTIVPADVGSQPVNSGSDLVPWDEYLGFGPLHGSMLLGLLS
jgi:hypothetical protein